VFDLVTFGEAMIRLSPPYFSRLEQSTSLDIYIGGAELNVAVTANRLGLKTSFVTRLTQNPLGSMLANKVREQGVDTSHILWTEEDRVGLYFVEHGALPRADTVLYDRAGSAMARIKPRMVVWDDVFASAKAFHVTGITPALGRNAVEATEEALRKAKEADLLVSFDVNYRSRLWTTRQAHRILTPLMKYVDILIATHEDAVQVLQIKGKTYEEIARKLVQSFGFKVAIITLDSTGIIYRRNLAAMAFHGGHIYKANKYKVQVVDRIGAGDAFAGAFLYTYISSRGDVEKALKYGVAASALKHSVPGDINWCTKEEVEKLIVTGVSRRVNR
jgi:2-dehydro-3-deoxygluconokinase